MSSVHHLKITLYCLISLKILLGQVLCLCFKQETLTSIAYPYNSFESNLTSALPFCIILKMLKISSCIPCSYH